MHAIPRGIAVGKSDAEADRPGVLLCPRRASLKVQRHQCFLYISIVTTIQRYISGAPHMELASDFRRTRLSPCDLLHLLPFLQVVRNVAKDDRGPVMDDFQRRNKYMGNGSDIHLTIAMATSSPLPVHSPGGAPPSLPCSQIWQICVSSGISPIRRPRWHRPPPS
jgi:hypothetical protein